jgi:molybdopterin/thiamine biosynthesis adenylyltransferase
VGIIGTMQAAQALQIIMDIGQTLNGRLLLWDAHSTEINQIQINKQHNCSVCSIKN